MPRLQKCCRPWPSQGSRAVRPTRTQPRTSLEAGAGHVAIKGGGILIPRRPGSRCQSVFKPECQGPHRATLVEQGVFLPEACTRGHHLLLLKTQRHIKATQTTNPKEASPHSPSSYPGDPSQLTGSRSWNPHHSLPQPCVMLLAAAHQ